MLRTLASARGPGRAVRRAPALLLVVLASTACGPLAPVMEAAGLASEAPVLGVEQVEEAVKDQYDATNPKMPAMAVECKTRKDAYLCGIQDGGTKAVRLHVLARARGEDVTVERVDEVAFLKEGNSLAARTSDLRDRHATYELTAKEQDLESLEYELELARKEGQLGGRKAELEIKKADKDLEKQEKAVK